MSATPSHYRLPQHQPHGSLRGISLQLCVVYNSGVNPAGWIIGLIRGHGLRSRTLNVGQHRWLTCDTTPNVVYKYSTNYGGIMLSSLNSLSKLRNESQRHCIPFPDVVAMAPDCQVYQADGDPRRCRCASRYTFSRGRTRSTSQIACP